MEVVEVERILLILKGLGFSQTSEETIKMMLGTQSFDLAEHDKQIRAEAINDYYNKLNEKINTDTRLKDTIRDIHDNVAREMYCKGIDDMFNEINICRTYDEYVNVLDILEIVKRLKEQN